MAALRTTWFASGKPVDSPVDSDLSAPSFKLPKPFAISVKAGQASEVDGVRFYVQQVTT